MSSILTTCQVNLWGKTVGYLADTGDGISSFEYDREFITSGLQISPVMMPLREGVVYKNITDPKAFDGMMGVFADSLPDLYGKKVVRHYFEKIKRKRFDSPLQSLMYIANRAIGALEYSPGENIGISAREALDMKYLVEQAKKVMKGEIEPMIAAIMASYATAGGQRPKAIIGWNRKTNEICAGVPPLPEGFEHWILKFDGADGKPKHYGRMERAYALMAKSAGIDVPETALIEENGRAHFLSKRFDRNGEDRLHMHSLGGLLHSDFNKARLLDYSDFLSTTSRLTGDHSQVEEAYRRMVFNVMARNQDDHVKNFAYLMDKTGKWRLSPAFDITYANGKNWTSQHQMTIDGESRDVELKHLLAVAKTHTIRKPAQVIEQVTEALKQWKGISKECGISTLRSNAIAKDFRWIADKK